jgi:hypothetical protein
MKRIVHRGAAPILFFVCLAAAASIQSGGARARNQAAAHPKRPHAAPYVPSPYLVIGFLGGFVRQDDPLRSEVKLAEDIRDVYPDGVHVETFENRRFEKAHKEILRLLDSNQNGTLSAKEKKNAHIILYGHSWGGTAVLKLARELERDGIPVLLTVQVDSVGRQNNVVPANVARAVNFYQPHGLVHGRAVIRAADPSRTEILGNIEVDYENHALDCKGYPWYERLFTKSHMEIGCDPSVWSQVELLIRAELPAPQAKPK